MLSRLTLLIASSLLLDTVQGRHPVILVNGLRGATLTASLNLPSGSLPHSYCKSSGTETMWVNPTYLVPGFSDCYNTIMALRYDEATGIFSDAPGVSISNVDFGGLTGIISGYFDGINSALTKQLGYTVGKDILGAPYDWRLGSDGMTQRGYFSNLKSLVENTYAKNGNTSVAFITHSMGCPVILEFLNQMTQEWKNQYVFKFIPLMPPFGGAVLSVQTAVSGSSIGGFGGDQAYLASQRREATGSWLLPQVGPTAWAKDDVVVITPSKNYTVGNFDDLFTDLNDAPLLAIYKAEKGLTLTKFEAPNVDTHVFYGTGANTISRLTYTYDLKPGYTPKSPSKIVYEDGDDTVPTRSAARARAAWASAHAANGYALEHTEFKGVSHSGILNNAQAITKIVSLLNAPSKLRGVIKCVVL